MTPARLAALHRSAFDFPRPWGEAEFGALLAERPVFVLGEAGGFILGRVVADEAEVLTLAVAPEARRQGIARRLVTAFLAEAELRGARRAYLEVAASNAAAQALYLSAGFAETGRRRGYFARKDGAREDALVLSRAFGAAG